MHLDMIRSIVWPVSCRLGMLHGYIFETNVDIGICLKKILLINIFKIFAITVILEQSNKRGYNRYLALFEKYIDIN